MPIELEKILTISARDYCEMHGKKLGDYTCVGVHATTGDDIKPTGDEGEYRIMANLSFFAENVPLETEVIVNYIRSGRFLSGTALIPKKRE